MISRADLSFIEAQNCNFRAIAEIHNSHVKRDQILIDQGFLLAKTSEEEIQQNINQLTQYFVAINSLGKILGFLAVSKPKISADFLNKICWIDASYQNEILSHKHLYIKIVATHLDYRGQGIAQFMYQALYEKFPDSVFSAFIVTKPLLNNRSILFHQKQGFKQIGFVQRDTFLDLQNYESVLMFKSQLLNGI